MRKIVDYFLDNSLLVNLITVLILFVGVVSAFTLKKEMFPTVDFDVVIIRTNYPGSSAEDVEKLVTISLERELKGIAGVRNLNAMSPEGSSIIYLELEAGEDLDKVVEDIRTAVDAVDDLPDEATKPKIISLNNKRRGIIKVAITGGTYSDIRSTAKKLRDQLEKINSIATINFDGYNSDEINIKVNVKKLAEYELSLGEIASTIKSRNLNLSAGTIETANGEINVRTVAEFKNIDDIKNLVVRSNDSGQRVLIKDIAVVERKPNPKASYQRSQGLPAIFVGVKMQENGDILKTVSAITSVTKKFFENSKYNKHQYRFVDDLSYYVKRRLNILSTSGMIGIFLVFGCLLLFFNFSTSFVTSLGAPIAFMTSFIIMQYMGLSINLISMFALILVLGMLVDDSIIVSEHFYQKVEGGLHPKQAAREAALETIRPVTATIITTLIAFGALFFMGGIMGKFLRMVPIVVIICLIASWIECFFILPSHLKDFCKYKADRVRKKKRFDRLKNRYGQFLNVILRRPGTVICVFVFIFVASIFTAKRMRFELFPGDDVRVVFLQVKGPVGINMSKTDQAIAKLEKLSMSLPAGELKQVKAQIGTMIGEHGSRTGSHYGSLILYLTPPTDRDRTTDEIITYLTKKAEKLVPDYDVTVRKIKGGPPRGKAVEIELTGDSIDDLKVVSKKVEKMLNSLKGVTSTEIDFEEGKIQMVASVDNYEAKRLGLSTLDIARELRRAFAGDKITEIRESDEDIEVNLMLDDASKSTKETLNELFVKNTQGQRIRLSSVVDFSEMPGAFVIRRKNRKRVFSVSGTLDKAMMTPVQVAKELRPQVEELISSYPNLEFSFGGENENTKESMVRLVRAGVIALLCIFFVLVLMFGSFGQPLVIMSAIPLGMIGVIWSFKVFGLALGFMALMGVVALVGVVVNDSIVLVNFVNIKVTEMEDTIEAVRVASMSRLRPVILTTVTTVAGLLPVAHAPGGDPFLKPMALSFAYGLLFATFVTLVFVPCMYLIYFRFLNWGKHAINVRRESLSAT